METNKSLLTILAFIDASATAPRLFLDSKRVLCRLLVFFFSIHENVKTIDCDNWATYVVDRD